LYDVVFGVGENTDICGRLIYVVFVFVSLLFEESCRELKSHHGNYMTDPIADMFIRIRNAQMVQKRSVVIPYSDLKSEILRVLKEAGFLEDIVKRGRRNHRVLDVTLIYGKEGARIRGLRRVSKQSQRIYSRVRDMHPSRKGAHGMFIISTSRGVLSSSAARESNIGGEIVCEVW
jgi:small subunit ribosomal protein S8